MCRMERRPSGHISSMAWERLPSEVAEWMGMDTAMLPFALDLAENRPA